MTTFDRYLLSRYVHIFGVLFIAAMGLYVVVDGFMNLDGFQHAAGEDGTGYMLVLMGRHYLFHASFIFELLGPTLAVMSVMCVLALTLRHGELYPVLAAGVPMYRLAAPFLVGVLAVNGLLAVNQEWIMPRIAGHLQGSHGETASDAQGVEPSYDTRWFIFISGEELYPDRKMIRAAEFVLPAPRLVAGSTALKADEAIYHAPQENRPAGWLLLNVRPAFEELPLSETGLQVVRRTQDPRNLFVLSELTFDELYNRSTSYRYLSTQELLRRIRRPSAGLLTRRAQMVHLHGRLTRPLLTLVGLFLVIPLVAHRERLSLVTNVAICMGVLGVVYGAALGLLMLGGTGLLRPELCAWAPLIGGGGLCAWLSPSVRT